MRRRRGRCAETGSPVVSWTTRFVATSRPFCVSRGPPRATWHDTASLTTSCGSDWPSTPSLPCHPDWPGFDTRAFRLTGGRWFELDDPQLLAYKEGHLPASDAPNPLRRIPVTFQTRSPGHYLAPLGGDDSPLVILEGVSMYLADDTIHDLAAAIRAALPRATLVCDLMSAAFIARFGGGLLQALRNRGASFVERTVHPSEAIERAGYHATRRLLDRRSRERGWEDAHSPLGSEYVSARVAGRLRYLGFR